jgi:hypothetical protein
VAQTETEKQPYPLALADRGIIGARGPVGELALAGARSGVRLAS